MLVGVHGLLGVDLQQAVEHGVHGFGVVQQFGVEQVAQLIHLIVARQALHPLFDLPVLAQQLEVLLVGGFFFRAGDEFFVDDLGGADLLVAHFQQFDGLLLHVRLTVHQQAVGQHPQAQGQLGEFVEALDAWHAARRDVFGGAADLAHLVQGEHPEDQHQAADHAKPRKARGAIFILRRDMVGTKKGASVRGLRLTLP